MRTAFIKTLCDLAKEDPNIWLLVGDLGYGVVEPFSKGFPDRFINAGVAEQNMVGVAAGLASCGKTVFTYSIGNFSTMRCLEQIRNDVCYHNLAVIIVSVGGGYAYGSLGMSHHATEDLAVMRALPCMTVVAPGDPIETELAVRALVKGRQPSYLRLGRAGETTVHDGPFPFELGRAVLVRDGSDLTLVSTGTMLTTAANVADRLSEQGKSVRVLSMHTVNPIDAQSILDAAYETKVIVTLEEHSVAGGLGGAVAEILAESRIPGVRFRRLGLPTQFCRCCGTQDYLLGMIGLSEKETLTCVQNLMR